MSIYFLRSGRAEPEDVLVRTPELRPLKQKRVALFGLGCLGAPIALELARAGVGALGIVDYDFVDPATIGRWPFGLGAAGALKAPFLQRFLGQNYPATRVSAYVHRLGGVAFDLDANMPSDLEIVGRVTEGAALVVDATAELGVQQFLSDYARQTGLPYIGVSGTGGGWGGKIFRFVPGVTQGCWLCYRHALYDGTIVPPPDRPGDEVQAVGCGDPTFTGAGFDMAQIALTAVRAIVATLCVGSEGGYPGMDWDVTILEFRDPDGKLIPVRTRAHRLPKHPECAICNPK